MSKSVPAPVRLLSVLLLVACAGGLTALPWAAEAARAQEEAAAEPCGSVRLVLVRHAEKEASGGSDPALTEAGEERARALSRLFAHAGATRFFASQFRRTADTLVPWAEASGADVERYDARDPEALVATLRGLEPGTLAAVAGHSNTIPDLARRLGFPRERLDARGFFPDDEYGRLLVVTLPVGCTGEHAPTLLELAF